MFKKLAFIALLSSLLAGCASVPMESETVSAKAKSFNSPTGGNAGFYIYRSSGVGTALKKDIWVDNKCIGESAPNVFFYEEVKGNKEHKISTESEFSPNELIVKAESGKNYFIKQYIKMGVFVGGANLELTGEKEGKEDVSELEMAKKGICSESMKAEGNDAVSYNTNTPVINQSVKNAPAPYQKVPVAQPQTIQQPIVQPVTQTVVEDTMPSYEQTYQQPQTGQSGTDLRYCLSLVNNAAIAKCVQKAKR